MIPVLLTLTLLVPSVPVAASPSGAAPVVRVHLFTNAHPSGLVDQMTKEREKAVGEVTKRIRKEKGVQIVSSPEQAQVVIEITSAAIVRAGERKTVMGALFGPPPGSGNPNALVPEIRAQLRAGDYAVEMVGSSQLRWKQCWNELAAQLKAWLIDNRAKLATR